MIAGQWLDPSNGTNRLFPVWTSSPMVAAYAVKRAHGIWSLMIVNKSASAQRVLVQFATGRQGVSRLRGTIACASFGDAQYVWHARGEASYAAPNRGVAIVAVTAPASGVFVIPKHSITVLRGYIGAEAQRS